LDAKGTDEREPRIKEPRHSPELDGPIRQAAHDLLLVSCSRQTPSRGNERDCVDQLATRYVPQPQGFIIAARNQSLVVLLSRTQHAFGVSVDPEKLRRDLFIVFAAIAIVAITITNVVL